MRQVFTTRRLENAEGVAKLLEDAGIETRIVNGRSYKGTHRHAFSYRDNAREQRPQPEVWVVRTDDLPRARKMLHEQGLLQESSRPGYAPITFHSQAAANDARVRTPEQRAMRLRMILLIACVLAAGWVILSH